jgi:hypothetical protein
MTRSREECPTFAMAMLAAIGGLPDTIMDRAVVIRMRRRAPGEKVTPFRTRRDAPALHVLRNRLHNWISPHLDALGEAEPNLPVEDRAADTWEPLVTVADLAGGDWPDRARRACLAMTGDEPDEGDGIRLLADLSEIWANDEDYIFTATILTRLHKVEESPWSECGRKSEPLNARGLAALLKPYGVRSRTVRVAATTSRGYARADLTDPWARYAATRTQSDTSDTATQTGETPDPTSEDGCVTCVSDCDSQNDTRSDLGEQPFCVAVSDVSDQVRETVWADAGPWGAEALILCRYCGDEIPETMPLARANGYCKKGRCIAAANNERSHTRP